MDPVWYCDRLVGQEGMGVVVVVVSVSVIDRLCSVTVAFGIS